jgi:GNAT superfamily N-acetyltransferase
MSFIFRLATLKDDAQLRSLMAATPVPGSVTVAFQREPDFFAACPAMGDCLVVMAIEAGSQKLAAAVCLARQERWWGNEPRPVGYVGGLRVHPDFRGAGILTKALPFLREVAATWGDIPWFTVIPSGNRSSEGLFVRNIRASFPKLTLLSGLYTLGMITGRSRRHQALPELAGAILGPASPEEVADFLEKNHQELRPCWTAEELRPGSGLGPLQLLGARRNGVLVGTAAVWDQEAFKQSVVKAYSPGLARLRPLYNLAAHLAGLPALPDPGQAIRSAYLSCFCVPEADSHHGRQLARLLLRESIRLARALGKDYLMAGFAVGDPVLRFARKHPHVSYHSGLYTFSFTGKDMPTPSSGVPVPSVEIGTL